jgi:hypothetical protein
LPENPDAGRKVHDRSNRGQAPPYQYEQKYNFSLSILWKSLMCSEGDKSGKYYL